MYSLLKKLKSIKCKVKKDREEKEQNSQNYEHLGQLVLSKDVDNNIYRLKQIMNNSFDIKDRSFKIAGSNVKAAVIYIDNLVDESILFDHILKPLIVESSIENIAAAKIDLEQISDMMLTIGNIKEVQTFDEIVLGIMSGETFLSIQGYAKGFLINAKGYQGRTIGEPSVEPSIRGPQEAFVEVLKINIGLIRRRLRDPNLCFEVHKLGRRGKSDVAIAYIKGIVDQDIVHEVRKRMDSIDIDNLSTTVEIGQLISDSPNCIFPLFQSTERPDKVVSALCEGRVAILMDGSPEAVIVPVTFPILMQSADDYFENWIIASFIRISRYISLLISTLLPALYISTVSFHPGMLPTNLALSIASTRSGVPFPVIIEAILMEFVLELLQEASIRLPKVVGQTVSIVGGLVIGQAAVQAGIVSPIMVIVIAITAVTSFTIPNYSLDISTRTLRIPFMILATTFGSFGVSVGILWVLTYLCSLESFGVGYMESLTPYRIMDLKDTIIRAPLWTFFKRPEFLNPDDSQKQKPAKRRDSIEE